MDECEETVKDRLLVRHENKRKITLLNKDKQSVKVVEVDDCRIKFGMRCDWLFVAVKNNDEIFVELKGSDIAHACLQIETTIPQLTADLKKSKYAIVVCSKVFPRVNPTIQSYKRKFKKNLNTELIVKESHCCFDIAKLKQIDCSKL